MLTQAIVCGLVIWSSHGDHHHHCPTGFTLARQRQQIGVVFLPAWLLIDRQQPQCTPPNHIDALRKNPLVVCG